MSEHVFTDNFLRACFVPSTVPNIINITKSLLTKACIMDKYNAETILCRQDNEHSCDLICWYGDFPGERLRICQPVVWEDPTFHRATKHCAQPWSLCLKPELCKQEATTVRSSCTAAEQPLLTAGESSKGPVCHPCPAP